MQIATLSATSLNCQWSFQSKSKNEWKLGLTLTFFIFLTHLIIYSTPRWSKLFLLAILESFCRLKNFNQFVSLKFNKRRARAFPFLQQFLAVCFGLTTNESFETRDETYNFLRNNVARRRDCEFDFEPLTSERRVIKTNNHQYQFLN